MFGHALHHHHICQCADDSRRGPAPFRTNQQTLARMLIDQVQQSYAAAIMRPCGHEVVAPYMVPPLRSEPHARAIVEPQTSAWLLLLRYLQPLATPDTLHTILAYPPAGPLQQRRDPAIPITSVLAGKLDDRLCECIFVFSPDRTIALRAARLVGQPASPALHHPMLLLGMVCCDPSSLRA